MCQVDGEVANKQRIMGAIERAWRTFASLAFDTAATELLAEGALGCVEGIS
ncbi:MAG: hypothetical protein ACI9DC_005027 [Gammaproteobacteria bacterium]